MLYSDTRPRYDNFGPSKESFDKFTVNVLKKIDYSSLVSGYGKNLDGNVSEYALQNEFYRVACTLLTAERCISPEVKKIGNVVSRGRLDFYINSNLNWGFELLINGFKQQQRSKEEQELSRKVYKRFVDMGSSDPSTYYYITELERHALRFFSKYQRLGCEFYAILDFRHFTRTSSTKELLDDCTPDVDIAFAKCWIVFCGHNELIVHWYDEMGVREMTQLFP